MLNNKVYDMLKSIVTMVLPAAIVFYVLIGETWGLSYVKEISTTLMGLEAFLGSVMGISTVNYNKTK